MLSLQCCSRLAGGRTRGRSAHLGQVRFSCGVVLHYIQLGLLWSGIFWNDMVLHGMAFYGLVLAKCTMVWHGLAEVWKSLAEVWYGLAEVW